MSRDFQQGFPLKNRFELLPVVTRMAQRGSAGIEINHGLLFAKLLEVCPAAGQASRLIGRAATGNYASASVSADDQDQRRSRLGSIIPATSAEGHDG
jgi:hypothetical protein